MPCGPASMMPRARTRQALWSGLPEGASLCCFSSNLAVAARLLALAADPSDRNILGKVSDFAQQHLVAGEAEDVADAIALAPCHGLDATVMTYVDGPGSGKRSLLCRSPCRSAIDERRQSRPDPALVARPPGVLRRSPRSSSMASSTSAVALVARLEEQIVSPLLVFQSQQVRQRLHRVCPLLRPTAPVRQADGIRQPPAASSARPARRSSLAPRTSRLRIARRGSRGDRRGSGGPGTRA